ncbi:DUF3429 domain-containing protein [Acidocella sp.]|uniref:DUF3429 domain-containing protein n=1 Tax=Acidocella sp. TaxID=50710 RepID=UPI00262C09F9|nr:DUF3429 domain-containing protein [Acidocella sp.]
MLKTPFALAILLTALGALPFLAFTAVVLLQPVGSPTAIEGLIAYGAVILSFLGAVHWGFALRETAHPVAEKLPPATLGAETQLLGFGVVPALIAWAGLIIMLHFHAPVLALFVLLVGFFLTVVVETIGRGRGVVALNYLILRWSASVVVLLCLLVTLGAVLSGMRVG